MKKHLLSSFELRSVTIAVLTGLLTFMNYYVSAEEYKYTDSWGSQGYTVTSQKATGVEVNYSVQTFSLSKDLIDGELMDFISLPGTLLPNNEGAPNLPGEGRFIAIPQGSTAVVELIGVRTETFKNVSMSPAFRIPWDTEKGPLEYNKDMSIYGKDEFYPSQPVMISEVMQFRGIDAVMLGVTPFQYNPVTKELIVYRDLRIKVEFTGGSGVFGDNRLRSRWWDPMLSDMLLNYNILPKVDYNKNLQGAKETGCEYLIITPNNSEFQQWADSIRKFRTLQGILTEVVTLAEVGGNTPAIIESYVNNAYNTWDIPPSACLLLGDYGSNAASSITSPIWDSYCVSDNIYADVDNNDMPDIVFARITAQNAAQLQVMVTKFLSYERNPPTSEYFYDHPITALGFQTERWFQICSEAVAGFWENIHEKSTVRVNKTYIGNPLSDPWSTATNTTTVVNYFGPNGLGYIPATPGQVNCTWNGTPAQVVTAINNGSFMLQHRDHGFEDGWGEPAFTSSNIPSLHNTDLTFVWSINCLTGKYNYSGECFAEKFHRHTYNGQNAGALGLNAASEVSYSFVNDAYAWGAFDNMWPEFMPSYGSTPEPRGILPAFASAAGKYFLQQSSWPYNTNNKEVTYNLFHHHGDAFMMVYSEVPQALTVTHNPILYAGVTSFDVTANEGALIALTVNGEIIATAIGTGMPLTIGIPGQVPPDQMLVTITKQNYYRYESYVEVIPPTGPYIVQNAVTINDAAGNGNGIMETSEAILASLTIKNVGVEEATNVVVTITTVDEYVTITDATEAYGTVSAGATAVVADGFGWEVSDDIPNMHMVLFEVFATDGSGTWTTYFSVEGHGPQIEFGMLQIDDTQGNDNGRLDPGETVTVIIPTYNNGSYEAEGAIGTLSCTSGFITLNSSTYDFGEIGAGQMEEGAFSITVSGNAPIGTPVSFIYELTSGGYHLQESYASTIGLIVEDWETGDMSQFDWTTGGNSNWALTTNNPYEGSYCIKSGSLGNSQTNYLSLQYEVFGPDSISFWYKVSSEASYDYLKFYIDNVQKDQWSGEAGWSRAAYSVTAGVHTFKWAYSKDVSVVSGSDCAWVDFIVLPVSIFEASFSANETSVCEGESINFFDETSGGAVSWEWVFEGGTPGTSTLPNPVIEYTTAGIYDVSLTVSNGLESNTLLLENYITVSTLPGIAPAPVGLTSVCAGWVNTAYSTAGLPGITTYDWVLEPSDAGNVVGTGLNVTVVWANGFLGNAALKVAGENICGTGPFSTPININRYLPEVTLQPFEWVCLGWPAFELTGGEPEGGEYSGEGINNGWFDPSAAGVGTHTITYTYMDPNGCENTASETILVDPCTGINDAADLTGIEIYPNPTTGIFTIGVDKSMETTEIIVVNTLNEVVYTGTITSGKLEINLSNQSKGIYYIRLKTGKNEKSLKIILQ